MTGSLLSFCVVALSIRGLQDKLTLFEILSLRNIGGLIILALMRLLAPSPDQQLQPDRFGLHVLRNVFHSIGQSLWAWGVIVLPLGTVFAIEFTTPVWVALFAVLFLGEKMTISRALALAAGLVGVLVILRPGLEGFRIEALAVVAAAIGFGVQIVTTKALTTTNSTFTILFWMNLMQLPMNLGANAVLGHSPLFMAKIDWSMWLPVIGIAVSGFTAHYCLTNAFRHG
ncbi:MAG: DMT family transporter, partial [Alphaproteobacteria bacterium]